MLIKVLDRIIKAEPEEEETRISAHTGKEIIKFFIRLSIQGEVKRKLFEDFIQEAKNSGLYEVNGNGEITTRYMVINTSYSYTGHDKDHDTLFSYIIYLEEKEELNINKLVICDYPLIPYEYEETIDGDALIIEAKVKWTNDERQELKQRIKGNKYFEVIRQGISEEKKLMRFGTNIWSSHDSFIKEKLIIVENIYDNKKPIKGFNYPEIDNLEIIAATNKQLLMSMLELLSSKKIISEDEIQKINNEACEKYKDLIIDFYRVKDIDEE